MPPDYAAFEAMVAPARVRPELWRLGLGMALATLLYLLSLAILAGAVWLLRGPAGLHATLEGFAGAGRPADTALLLFSFVGMALAAIIAARNLQGRGALSLIGPEPRRALADMLRCAGSYGALLLAITLPFMAVTGAEPNLPPGRWLAWLLPGLALLLLQVGAEEMLFRGYLQTQLAARFRRPAVWIVLPALAFGLAHYAPAQSGPNAWSVVAAVGLYGLIAADLTARTGSIGAATGFHLANNAVAILLFSTEGTINGLSLYRTPYAADAEGLAPLMVFDALVMIAGWLLCRRVLRRADA